MRLSLDRLGLVCYTIYRMLCTRIVCCNGISVAGVKGMFCELCETPLVGDADHKVKKAECPSCGAIFRVCTDCENENFLCPDCGYDPRD